MSGARWWLDAACRDWPTEWWYPAKGDVFTLRMAKGLCAACPVKGPCLDAALAEEQVAGVAIGIRGGLTADVRARLWPRITAAHDPAVGHWHQDA